ncbi:RNA methyltransferase [Streptomyces sodiiphilus]|uniref:RNA methyltransferase n=1 Tax=Streptomyces sodiiphilus TaxID=226217 RepID=A0ABN2NRP2_9ACTN
MSAPVRITDPADPRLSDYTALTDVALRRTREVAEGLFMAEGEKVIRRALAAGYPPRSVLLTDKWLDAMGDLVRQPAVPVYVVDPGVAEQVTGYHVHRGALAAMRRLPLPSAAGVLAGARRLAVLEGVNDHTNIGALFRSAAALGIDAVLLSPDCADPLYRRAVKVSMGAVFTVPYARVDRWPHCLEDLREAGFRLLALTPDSDAQSIAQEAERNAGPTALLLGAEGEGLSRRALAAADARVRIPMARGVDSLNVAAAAAVAFYALTPREP